jgi:outer membrane protein assembly factor BamB
MSSNFPLQYYTGVERGGMNEYFVPDATNGAAIVFNSLVFQNTSDQEIELCGADPALILGIAKAAYADKFLYALNGGSGRLPVSVLSSDVMIGLCVTGTPVATDAGKDYGIVLNGSGNLSVDLSETSATRFHVVKVDLTNGIYWGYFIAANLQADAVAS